MEDLGRRRRHNNALGQQHGSSARFASQTDGSAPSSSPAERYRPVPANAPSHSQTPRSAGNYSGYYQEATSGLPSASMLSSAMGPYGAEYGQDERHQPPGLSSYNPAAMMYNVAQANTQPPVYDAQHFGSRQPAAMQMMPDVASTYFSTDSANQSSSNLPHQTQGPGSSAGIYQQNPAMNYAGGMQGVTAVQLGQGSGDGQMAGETEYSDGALEEKWHSFQQRLVTVFQDITSGSLETASETLLTISTWLLSQVTDLGLTEDDASLHAERIKLWDNFNHAWLALGQKQLDLMQTETQTSQTQRPLATDKVEKLGDEIVRLCDGLERHGLVDYQYGVWEDQIIAIFEECLNLNEADEERETSRR